MTAMTGMMPMRKLAVAVLGISRDLRGTSRGEEVEIKAVGGGVALRGVGEAAWGISNWQRRRESHSLSSIMVVEEVRIVGNEEVGVEVGQVIVIFTRGAVMIVCRVIGQVDQGLQGTITITTSSSRGVSMMSSIGSHTVSSSSHIWAQGSSRCEEGDIRREAGIMITALGRTGDKGMHRDISSRLIKAEEVAGVVAAEAIRVEARIKLSSRAEVVVVVASAVATRDTTISMLASLVGIIR